MSTAHLRDKADKKAAKAEKEAAKEAARAEKEAAFQAKLVEQFNEKQTKAKAAATPSLKLKEWLQNPPYKCTDAKMQVRYIFYP